MLRKLLPHRVKSFLKGQLLHLTTSPLLFYTVPFLPFRRQYDAYVIYTSGAPDQSRQPDSTNLAVPPQQFWLGYGSTGEEYLASGKKHVDMMLSILEQFSHPLKQGERILDFGCAAGRMLRWLESFAKAAEVWGADVNADHIMWCEQYLSPPFHFLISTAFPHLPFEDNYFDLVYAGSVFTHIDDLAKTWLMELRRILRPGGCLYVTLHDKSAINILNNHLPGHPLTQYLHQRHESRTFIQTNFAMFTIGRSFSSQVFYDIDYFCQRFSAIYDVLSVTPEAYGYQTAVLLQKRQPKEHR